MARKGLSLTAIALAVLLVIPLAARAEPYLAVYGGGAFPQDEHIDWEWAGPPGGEIKGHERVNSGVIGGKVGYWLEPLPYLGFEAEVSYHQEDLSRDTVLFVGPGGSFDVNFGMDVSVLTFGFNLMGRAPLSKSKAFPRGRLQPYAGVGLGIFRSEYEDTTGFIFLNVPGEKDKDTSIGLQLLAGVKAFFTKNVAAFVEYKFTTHKPELSFTDELGDTLKLEPRANTHFVYGGIAVHF